MRNDDDELPERLQGHHLPSAVIGHPQLVSALFTSLPKRRQDDRSLRFGLRSSSCHGCAPCLQKARFTTLAYTCCQGQFAIQPKKSGPISTEPSIEPREHAGVSLEPNARCRHVQRFFCKALHVTACSAEEQVALPSVLADITTMIPTPRVINVDKNAAYPKAISELKAAGVLPDYVELRQVKYLNNLIEQDHRFIKRLRHPWHGLFLVRDSVANITGIRGDEHDQEGATARSTQRRCGRAGYADRQAVWNSRLN